MEIKNMAAGLAIKSNKNYNVEKVNFTKKSSVEKLVEELFEAQDNAYQTSVLGKDYAHRISIEMGSTLGWHKFAKFSIGVDKFGASGKANDVIKNFGFTKETIAKIILDHIR